jgi:hypothetical protein
MITFIILIGTKIRSQDNLLIKLKEIKKLREEILFLSNKTFKNQRKEKTSNLLKNMKK